MMGFLSAVGWTVRCPSTFLSGLFSLIVCVQTVSGMTVGVFPPVVPPTVPIPQRVLDAAVASQAEALFLVPSFCEVSMPRTKT